MLPSDFRRVGYSNRLSSQKKRTNNFYNGQLKLGFLNSHKIPSETDIYKLQKQMIQTYCGTLKKKKVLNGINIDILNAFQKGIENFNIYEDTIVNNINQQIDQIIINYSKDMSLIRKETKSQNYTRLKAQANQAYNDYIKILNLINSNNNIAIGYDYIQLLERLNNALKMLRNAIDTDKVQGQILNPDITGYYYSIQSIFREITGSQLEVDVVQTAQNWLPKIDNI